LKFLRTRIFDRKKKIKLYLSTIIKDFGDKHDKVQFIVTQNKSLLVRTNIFNFKQEFLKEFVHLYIRKSDESLEINKDDLFKYLKVIPQHLFELSNNSKDILQLHKTIVPYDIDTKNIEEDENKKYELFYSDHNEEMLKKVRFFKF